MATKFAVLICVIGFALITGCASHGSSVHGQVFEVENPEDPPLQWKKVPSSGAFVVISWSGIIPRPVDATSACLHVSIAKTDEHGKFSVPGWWALPKFYPVIEISANISAYKPGYLSNYNYYPYTEDVVYLKIDQRSAENRLIALGMMSEIGCWQNPAISDPGNNLGAYYRALYEEARQLEVTSRIGKWNIDKLRQKVEIPPNNDKSAQ